MSNFANILTSAMGRITGIAGAPVVYARGEGFVKVKAVHSTQRMAATDNFGITIALTSQVFTIEVCQLVISGVEIEPELDDTITEMVGSKQFVYRVCRADKGEQLWTYVDTGKTYIKVHALLEEILNG